MHAVVALGIHRSVATAGIRLLAIALFLCAAFDARASGEDADALVVAQALLPATNERLRPQVEVSATSLPRFDNVDGATRSSRIDMALLPPRPSAFGPALGMTSSDGRPFSGGRPFANGSTSVDLGLHWRYTSDSNHRFDITAWRRMKPLDAASLIQDREPTYGARVEMSIAAAPKAGLVADRGFLGFQLESGARVTVRRSGGKPMIYYRSKF